MLPSLTVPIFGGAISTYALIRTAYVLMALVLVTRLNERQGIPSRLTLTAFALGVPAGLVGAHLLDLVEYWDRHRAAGVLDVGQGSSIYGAFLAVFALVWAYARWAGFSALRFLDAGAPAMALGEAMTRIGCFLNGCCYGVPWDGPLAVVFPRGSFAYHDQIARGLLAPAAPTSLAVHPVQLYSAASMLVAFVVLLRRFARPHREGTVFFAFLVAYGTLRLAVAPVRQEVLPSMVAFSVGFVVIGLTGLAARRGPVVTSGATRGSLRDG